MIKKLLKKIYSPVLNKLNRLEYPEYIRQIEQAHKAGYNYHQKLIKSDPELLVWVTQEHYLSDKLENHD